jgi:hypothetical protein
LVLVTRSGWPSADAKILFLELECFWIAKVTLYLRLAQFLPKLKYNEGFFLPPS